jgi:hypothetical protein
MKARPTMSAIDRARIAYEHMEERKRQAATARQTRDRSRNIRVAAACAGAVLLLLGLAIHYQWMPASLRSVLRGDPEAGEFGRSRTGHVRSVVKGDTCQELRFDNSIGRYIDGYLIPCEVLVGKESPAGGSGQRVISIRDAFAR